MARLPTREKLGPLPSIPAKPLARIDTSAIGRGVADIGRGISKFSAALDAVSSAENQAQQFETERRFQEFKWQQQKALDQSMRQIEPGGADGFAEQWAESYKAGADEFAQSVPEALRQRYDLKLFDTERRFYGNAAGFARKEQKRHSLAQINDQQSSYYSRASAGEPLDDIRSDYRSIIAANPYLTPIEKDEELRKGYGSLEEVHLRSRIDRGDNLDDILRDLHGRTGDERDGSGPQPVSNIDRQAAISVQLETGKTDPLSGISNISRDAGNTKSYGNFGLNSQAGGPIFKFAKEYGKDFGLTAKPGTAAFDEQWQAAAQAQPQELHQAEMAWYAENVSGGLAGKLTKAGISKEIANDARVQAYFADRTIQLGPGSIDASAKHKRRIKSAFEEADGDPVAFLQALTELDREALEQDFPTALKTKRYSAEGHDTRVDGRLQLALDMPGELADDPGRSGPYGNLPADRRRVLAERARIASRNKVLQDVRDGVEEMRRTGVAALDEDGETAIERASRVLTKNQLEKAKIDWAEAQLEFAAFDGMDALREEELQERLREIEPKTGEELYQVKAKIFDRAARLAETIRDDRDRDPAASVSAFPEVSAAEQGVRDNPDDPEFKQALLQARIDAQAKIGIPEGLRSTVTEAEARVILAPTRGLEARELYDSLREVQERLEEDYGPYARAAASDVFQFDKRSRETAKELASILGRAFKHQAPTAAGQRRIEVLDEIDLATRSFGGQFVGDPFRQFSQTGESPPADAPFQAAPQNYFRQRKPPQKAIEALRAKPDLADEFEAYYGTGSSQQYLLQF